MDLESARASDSVRRDRAARIVGSLSTWRGKQTCNTLVSYLVYTDYQKLSMFIYSTGTGQRTGHTTLKDWAYHVHIAEQSVRQQPKTIMSPSLSATDLFTVKGLVAVVTGGATGR